MTTSLHRKYTKVHSQWPQYLRMRSQHSTEIKLEAKKTHSLKSPERGKATNSVEMDSVAYMLQIEQRNAQKQCTYGQEYKNGSTVNVCTHVKNSEEEKKTAHTMNHTPFAWEEFCYAVR